MLISELEPGDVLFTMAGGKPPALHTQIYTSDSHFEQTIIHAVDDTRPNGPSKLMATGLKTDDMLVFRCRRGHMAYEAYNMAVRWAKYLVPYDQERKTLKEAYRNLIPEETDKVALMKTLFRDHGMFRAIKYTARRDEILCYPSDGGEGKGLTCTMFVILCYQAAALAAQVMTTAEVAKGAGMVRVSDKKMTSEELKILVKMAKVEGITLSEADLSLYKSYVDRIQSGNEYEIKWEEAGREAPTRAPRPRLPGYRYVPSILCWKGPSISGFGFAEAMTGGMMVDAKITTSEQLRLCLKVDGANWEEKGYLSKSEGVPLDPKYKEKLNLYSEYATSSRKAFFPKTPGMPEDKTPRVVSLNSDL